MNPIGPQDPLQIINAGSLILAHYLHPNLFANLDWLHLDLPTMCMEHYIARQLCDHGRDSGLVDNVKAHFLGQPSALCPGSHDIKVIVD
jgi:hypothetical protein